MALSKLRYLLNSQSLQVSLVDAQRNMESFYAVPWNVAEHVPLTQGGKNMEMLTVFSLRHPGQAWGSETRLTETEGNTYVTLVNWNSWVLHACNLSISTKWKGQSMARTETASIPLVIFFPETIIQKKASQGNCGSYRNAQAKVTNKLQINSGQSRQQAKVTALVSQNTFSKDFTEDLQHIHWG